MSAILGDRNHNHKKQANNGQKENTVPLYRQNR